jgi:hypothetical protein
MKSLRGSAESESGPDPPKWQLCSDGVHYAYLHFRAREDYPDCFRQSFQPAYTSDEDVSHARILQLGNDTEPELCSFCLCDPEAEDFFHPLKIHPSAR